MAVHTSPAHCIVQALDYKQHGCYELASGSLSFEGRMEVISTDSTSTSKEHSYCPCKINLIYKVYKDGLIAESTYRGSQKAQAAEMCLYEDASSWHVGELHVASVCSFRSASSSTPIAIGPVFATRDMAMIGKLHRNQRIIFLIEPDLSQFSMIQTTKITCVCVDLRPLWRAWREILMVYIHVRSSLSLQ